LPQQPLDKRIGSGASAALAVIAEAFVQGAPYVVSDRAGGGVEVTQILLDQVRVMAHARAQFGAARGHLAEDVDFFADDPGAAAPDGI
jgi:hypothetical protein